MLFERTGDIGVLNEAVQAGREAVAAVLPGHPDLAGVQNNLGVSLRILFEQTGDESVLTEAETVSRAAVAGTPAGSYEVAQHLANLGFVLMRAAQHTGEVAVLAEAVQAGRDAVATAGGKGADLGGILTNLTAALQQVFQWTGDISVLDEATQMAREAVAATREVDPNRAKVLSNLAGVLGMDYDRTGDTTLLHEALGALYSAIAAVGDGDADGALLLSNLEGTLLTMFDRTGSIDALTTAVQAGRESVAGLPATHSLRSRHLSNLSVALQTMGEHTADIEMLAESVRIAREALDSAAPDDLSRALNHLGLGLQASYEVSGDLGTLEEAIRIGRETVAVSQAGQPLRAVFLNNLGRALRLAAERADYPGQATAQAEAARCYAESANNAGARAVVRIEACHQLAGLSGQGGVRPEDALSAAEIAVELLPRVASRQLVRPDREHRLAGLASLAAQAAAAAVMTGQSARAVELLEQTRGVLVTETIDTRNSDLSQLEELQPGLADEFRKLRVRLDVLGSTIPAVQTMDDVAGASRQRRQASADWESLLARIRSVDGLADFLRPPDIQRLAACAKDGPVVMTYTSPTRCDALILTAAPNARAVVRTVPLTRLTEAAAAGQIERLRAAVQAGSGADSSPHERRAAQQEIRAVLAWEWDTIAEPVLSVLGYTASPGDGMPWPRLWWCPVGTMASLPLHAAGYHDGGGSSSAPPRAVMDLVISSYTTTLRALGDAQAHETPVTGDTLIVPAPQPPGAPPLPGIVDEVQTLGRLIPGAQILAEPTRAAVLAALPLHPVTHFACHGQLDLDNPAASRLVLDDHQTAPLTVADISALRFTGALAYLSACDTAITSPALADEAVHLLGAFQLAGYQQVIGTLWPVSDSAAESVAADFYGHLTRQGSTAPAPRLAAEALHHAVRRQRDLYPESPALWAAHIHTGA